MADQSNGKRLIHTTRDRMAPRSTMSSREIKDEIIAGVAAGSLAIGQKVYNQCMEETTRLLAEMEARFNERLDARGQP